ncbi:hypothetical protein BN874_430004 [Candidatus Contendobacter odensis Run_B_J11]|uniref:Uncharacterized protein n=1 Tax=Candidatus Contendobacter odensis Run_B_J11 TaxID=1400861 RepID=A0A7U7J5F6_9GAMM|nr:hypothetical protein BN874_430004 [Candidatus Contendobacter odensis Run_B_J11]
MAQFLEYSADLLRSVHLILPGWLSLVSTRYNAAGKGIFKNFDRYDEPKLPFPETA